MENQNCYIEFEIQTDKNFVDLKNTFELVKESKNNENPKPDEYWLAHFPEYALKYFYFLESDKKPPFQTAQENEFTWHFYSLIELLQINYEIEYVDCFKISTNIGRLEYDPFSYPYGGITGLITFISSFNCNPTIVDDGTSLYKILFKENRDFAILDLHDPKKQHSSGKKFAAVELLKKLWNRRK